MKIGIVGAGAAGLMATKFALDSGADVTLLEKNEKAGKKIYITGKGRCNVTNACDKEDFMKNLVRNPRFLYSALSVIDNKGVMSLFESLGVPLKVERGERVFPESDHASDITKALENYVRRGGANILYNTSVKALIINDGVCLGVVTDKGEMRFDRVILATGGLSYPSTGSDGDGHRLMKSAGHSIVPCRPALSPLETEEKWVSELMGLSLKNVTLHAYATVKGKRKRIYSEQGEMLFTHFGVSGPLVLTLSSLLPEDYRGTELRIDLKPALNEAQLDARFLRDFANMPNKQLISFMDTLEPHALGEMILNLCGISPYIQINSVTAAQRKSIISTVKALPLTVKNIRSFDEAIVTRGGVNVKEIDPSTMQSKLVKNLYAAGELLDADALTGGFNLTIAFAMGALAGKSAATIDA
ncbi:MAG: NAD(P)/FAD-dependent oxidoreductase [Clostridia bacterium]|nr:NAD(P)/FAD-dependent oxidoreductase [Clostridia bacterium]